jgi:inorganic pyrophosphatase
MRSPTLPPVSRQDFSSLGPFDGDHRNVIIETPQGSHNTPQGSHNKFDFDPERGLFVFSGVLTLGAVFPFDFGLVPATLGEDGDPLDALVLMEEPAFPGCFVASRLLGVIEAEQTERDGTTQRNDRLVCTAVHSHVYREMASLDDLGAALVGEAEHFFVSYNEAKGKQFRPMGRGNAVQARRLVEEGHRRHTA